MNRRQFLGGTSIAISAGVAGCTDMIFDFIAGWLLEDVNLVNETDHPVSGSIEITDPDGAVVLEEQFELAPAAEDDEDTEADQSQFADVFATAGSYEFVVELDAGSAVNGVDHLEDTVEISEPGEEYVLVGFGAHAEGDWDEIEIVVFGDIDELEETEIE